MGTFLGPWYKRGAIWFGEKRGRGSYRGEGNSRPIRAADDPTSKKHEDAPVSIAYSHSSFKMRLIEKKIYSIRPSFREVMSDTCKCVPPKSCLGVSNRGYLFCGRNNSMKFRPAIAVIEAD